jgi:murein DD-endopeptidase MepM/ murein hydrolase activator NlpD
MPFPLPFVPIQSYRLGGRRFGADRQKGRKHAGCDLIAPVGTPIVAMADGIVAEWTGREFYHGTFAMAVQHHGFVARYCEIKGVAPGIGCGTIVKAGDVIAFVGKMHVDSMLHLEIYSGAYGKGGLTNRKNQPFQRRSDLQNPTPLLDRLVNDVPTLEF